MRFKKYILNTLYNISPRIAAQARYYYLTKKRLNLSNPVTFDEKIQWLKFYWQDELVVKCADKYTVRDYVKSKGLENILTELYGVFQNTDNIDFSILPEQFVLKTTNACRTNIIVKNKKNLDIDYSKKKLREWMNIDFSKQGIEPHYSHIPPRIIAEEFLEDQTGNFLTDYKFFCFNGEARFVEVITERTKDFEITRNFYDLSWNKLDFTKERTNNNIRKPKKFNEMIRISQILCKDFPFVRVDLYDIENSIVFGELTFTPAAGFGLSYTDEAQLEIGKMLDLPLEKKYGFKS